MREAWNYASRGTYSEEIDKLKLIDRFGVEAVLGRKQLYYKEMRRMIYAREIVDIYFERERAGNRAEWMNRNPKLVKFLSDIERIANG